jgi:hypothetical protein
MLRVEVMSGIRVWLNFRRVFAGAGRIAFAAPVLGLSTACAAAAAGGVTLAVGGAAFGTSTCYDRVSLRLVDAATGQLTCQARVSAVDPDGSELSFNSCFHAAVPRGKWTVRAERAGYVTSSTALVVPVQSHCDSAVQTIDMVITPVGYQPPPRAPVGTPSSPPAAPAAAPSTVSAQVPVPAPAPTPAATPVSPVAPAPSPPAPAPSPPVPSPPTGAFPSPPDAHPPNVTPPK